MKIVLSNQSDKLEAHTGGDVITGHLELQEECLTGYEISVSFEGQLQSIRQ